MAFSPYYRGKIALNASREWLKTAGMGYPILKGDVRRDHKSCHIFAKMLGFTIVGKDDNNVYLEKVNYVIST